MLTKRIPFDRELEANLPDLNALFQDYLKSPPTAQDVIIPGLLHEEHTFTGPDNNTLVVSVFHKSNTDKTAPQNRVGIYTVHGGGMIIGNRFTNIAWAMKCVQEFDAICVSIEYRLAPEHPDPAPVEDCYAGLIWMRDHAEELGIDPTRIMLHGVSAGGGLCLGASLLYRDRNQSPPLFALALFAPMVDDVNDSGSAHAFSGVGVWDREVNGQGWDALLGSRRGTDDVSIYAAPIRATDFSGLPTMYVDVGSTETFRDEDVLLARKVWRDGVQCELHVWPGAYHGFYELCPKAELSRKATKTRLDWFRWLNI